MIKSIIRNGFILFVPILAWNLIFTPKLTQAVFASDTNVSRWILVGETVFRVAVFLYPFFLRLQWSEPVHNVGWVVYGVGTLVYFSAWLPLVYAPTSAWSQSTLGLLAPYITPFVFFAGVGLIGQSWGYIVLAAIFTVLHTWHGIQSLGGAGGI